MRESGFINQNKKKWNKFEATLGLSKNNPEELNDIFVQINDDLSYARTFYPNRSVRVYLNNIAQRTFSKVYKNRRANFGKFVRFYTHDLPLAMYDARRDYALAIFVFFLSMLIGIVSCYLDWAAGNDMDFARTILGDGYIAMTLDNIDNNDPMAVYKSGSSAESAFGITMNNLFVAALTFLSGLFFSVGAIFIMIRNGIMVGVFQFLFVQQAMEQENSVILGESILTIWMHGTLEISAIILAGAAGIVVGKGLIFPGSYPRLQAFLLSARHGLKLFLAVVPFLLIAGFIEGFITRITGNTEVLFQGGGRVDILDFVRLIFIISNLAFVIYYLILLPIRRNKQRKKGKIKRRAEDVLMASQTEVFDFEKIRSPGEIFKDAFVIYQKKLLKHLLVAGVSTTIFCVGVFLLSSSRPHEIFTFPELGAWFLDILFFVGDFFAFIFNERNDLASFLGFDTLGAKFWLSCLLYTIVAFVSLTFLKSLAREPFGAKVPFLYHLSNFFKLLGIAFVGHTLLLWGGEASIFRIVLIGWIPLLSLWAAIIVLEGRNFLGAFTRTFSLVFSNFWQMAVLSILLYVVSVLFVSILASPFLMGYVDAIAFSATGDEDQLKDTYAAIKAFINQFVFSIIFGLIVTAFGLSYFTLREIKEAPSLLEKIKYVGTVKRIRGLEREK